MNSTSDINAATVEQLLEHVTTAPANDPFTDVLVLMYSYFVTLEELFEKTTKVVSKTLDDKNVAQNEQRITIVRFFNFLKKLVRQDTLMLKGELKGNVEAAKDHPDLKLLEDLIKKFGEAHPDLTKWSVNLEGHRKRMIEQLGKDNTPDWFKTYYLDVVEALEQAPSGEGVDIGGTTLPAPKLANFSSIQDVDPQKFAQQVTLVDQQMLRRITMNQLLHKAFSKSERSYDVAQFVKRFNTFSFWLVGEILKTIQLKRRASVIATLIEIARHLKQINNFSSCISLLSALRCTPIARLRQTWKNVPKQSLQLFEELSPLADPNNNYAAYRKAYDTAQMPMIPYLGCITKDITGIEEIPTKTSDDQVNWSKMLQMGNILLQLRSAQETVYTFPSDSEVLVFIASAKPMGENEQYTISNMLEPSANALPAARRASSSIPVKSASSSNLTSTMSLSSSPPIAASSSTEQKHKQTSNVSSSSSSSSLSNNNTNSSSSSSSSSSGKENSSSEQLKSVAIKQTGTKRVAECVECKEWEHKRKQALSANKKAKRTLQQLRIAELERAELVNAYSENKQSMMVTKQLLLDFMKKKKELKSALSQQDEQIEALKQHDEHIRDTNNQCTDSFKEATQSLGQILERLINIQSQLESNQSLPPQQLLQVATVSLAKMQSIGEKFTLNVNALEETTAATSESPPPLPSSLPPNIPPPTN